MLRVFSAFGPVHLGSGFQVRRAVAHDEPDAVLYKIDIWGTWTIYASILKKEDNADFAKKSSPQF